MSDPNFILLYVDSPVASEAFYTNLLGKAAFESHPTFAAFMLESGVTLGLWSKHTVEPASTPVGGSELGFAVADAAEVEALYAAWSARGIEIVQMPVALDFGFTFVGVDPDGHRLRVFAPAGGGRSWERGCFLPSARLTPRPPSLRSFLALREGGDYSCTNSSLIPRINTLQ